MVRMNKKMASFRMELEALDRLRVLSAYSAESQARTLERLVHAAWEQRHADTGDPLQTVGA